MQIGEVARETGLTVDAIRFYERRGLLREPVRSDGGFRLYVDTDVSALRFIRRMQALGFSLEEIGELLALRSGAQPCAEMRDMLSAKLSGVRTKLDQLQALQRDLAGALRTCNRQLRRRDTRRNCPVLDERPNRRSKR